MTDPIRNRAGDGLTVIALAIAAAVAVPIAQLFGQHGWFSMAVHFGRDWFWLGVLAWIASTVLAIRWRRRWWLLVTAPAVLLPALVVAAVTFECSRGNCL